MPWVIGLADQAEVNALQKAGYKIESVVKGIEHFAIPDVVSEDMAVAIYVDCDITRLLLLHQK